MSAALIYAFKFVYVFTVIVLSLLYEFAEKLSQQSGSMSYQLQSSFSTSQHQPQTSVSHMAYLTPSPYLTPNPPDSNPASYLTFGPGGSSAGLVTYSTGGNTYLQPQSTGQILLQTAGRHGEVEMNEI